LPQKYVSGSTSFFGAARFVLPALEILLLVPLVLIAPRLRPGLQLIERLWKRRAILGLVGLISLANGSSPLRSPSRRSRTTRARTSLAPTIHCRPPS